MKKEPSWKYDARELFGYDQPAPRMPTPFILSVPSDWLRPPKVADYPGAEKILKGGCVLYQIPKR